MPTISYAITACNEHVELDRLLNQLTEHIRPEDEIVVQLDTNYTPEVRNVVEGYGIGKPFEFHRIFASLNGDFASFKNNLETVKYLIEKGTDDVNTALIIASYNDNLEIIKYLCENGADVNAQTKIGKIALTLASFNYNSEIVKYLESL